ncbi:MAG: hypothetical protein AAGF31_05145 [Planctomycetota bacterium]
MNSLAGFDSPPATLDRPPPDWAVQVVSGAQNAPAAPLAAGATTIGGGPRCSLRVKGEGVQPLHCVISPSADGLVVRRWAIDTKLNGDDFSESPLKLGDRLTVGSVEMVVTAPDDFVSASDTPAEDLAEKQVETEPPQTTSSLGELAAPLPAVPAHLLQPWLAKDAATAERVDEVPATPSPQPTPPAAETDSAKLSEELSAADSALIGETRGIARGRVRKLVDALREERERQADARQREEQLTAEHAELTETLATLRLQAEQAETTEAELRADQAATQLLLGEATQLAESLQATIAKRDTQIEELQAEVSRIESELAERASVAESYEQRVTELELAIAQLEQQSAADSAPEAPEAERFEEVADEPENSNESASTEAETDVWQTPAETDEGATDDLADSLDEQPAGLWDLPTADATSPTQEDEEEQRASELVDEAAIANAEAAADTDASTAVADLWSQVDLSDDAVHDANIEADESRAREQTICEQTNGEEPNCEKTGQSDAELAPAPAADDAGDLWDIEANTADPAAEPADSAATEGAESDAAEAWLASFSGAGEPAVSQPEAREPEVLESDEPAENVLSYDEPPAEDEAVEQPAESPHVAPSTAPDLFDDSSAEFDAALFAAADDRFDEEASIEQRVPTDNAAEPTCVDDLIPEQQPKDSAPESFIERYANLLPADDADDSPVEPLLAAAPTPPAEPSFAVPAEEDSDESIEGYMASLMQRIRGEAEPAAPAPLPKRVQPATPTPSPAAPVESLAPTKSPITDLSELKRGPAAEQSRDMSALRELANSSARSAIGVAVSKQNNEKAVANLAICGIAMACGGYLALTSGSLFSLQFVGGLAGFGWAGYWGAQVLKHLVAAGQAKATSRRQFDDDAAATQSEALPIDSQPQV